MPFALDLHCHSRFSYDSQLDPLRVLRRARAKGLGAIAITDHETIQGGMEAKRINPFSDLLVIVGAEIRTEIGDVVGLFLQREILSRSFAAVAKDIHEQGGLVLLPHPGKLPISLVEPLIDSIDIIEEWNARSKPAWNESAQRLAMQCQKPTVACSDAHSWFEVSRAYTILDIANASDVREGLLKANRTLVKHRTNFYLSHVTSVLTQRWKRLRS